MAIFGLLQSIIWFAVVASIIRMVIRRSGGGSISGRSSSGSRPGSSQTGTASQTPYTGSSRSGNASHTLYAGGRPQTGSGQTQGRYAGMTGQNAEKKTNDSQAMSTLEYLEAKARQDQKEHAEEQRREQLLDGQKRGGAAKGLRLYEGDSVPAGMRPVKCGYCGADNLIPQNAHGQYTCYFCREAL